MKILVFSLYRTDGTDDILLKLKKKKSIYKKKVILRENSKNICGICGNY